ncbi:MAG: hypothetical protein CMJ67_09470 [Planctomycetaceae bacterium]|nr:hypothetical protein [Planctomycetaceae bacterium]
MPRIRILFVLALGGLLGLPVVASAQDGMDRRPDRRSRQADRERGMGQDRARMRSGGGKDPFDRSPHMKAGGSLRGWDGLAVHGEDGGVISVDSLVPEEGTLVVVNGCLTCPKFLRSYPGMEAVARDHAGNEKVRFVYLYKTLAHPENDGFVQAFTLQERLAQMAEAKKRLKTSIPFVCDGIDNRAMQAFGGSPNSQVVVDGDGKILHAAGWADSEKLRKALIEIVGETETTTDVDDLDLPAFRGVTRPAGKVVPRVRPTESLSALRMEPGKSDETYFVKLRAEASQGAMSGREGELYLGFHLDPLHDVHWNNLVDPITFEVVVPEGVELLPPTGAGPKVEAATDTDPREFLLKIKGWKSQGPLEVKVVYYACSDAGGDEAKAFCRKIEQVYLVHPERDRGAGFVQSRSRVGGRGGPGGRGAEGNRRRPGSREGQGGRRDPGNRRFPQN